MTDIILKLNDKGRGAFNLYEDDKKMGEMVISVTGNDLTVYHTQVASEAEGKGYGKQLLATLADYARAHKLTVIPLCPYVLGQFNRHSDDYADIWHIN